MIGTIFLWIISVLAFSIILFFILLSNNVIKRTDFTVKIEHFIESSIGFILRIFLPGFGGVIAKEIENNKLKLKCKHCGYIDDVNRQFCLNCNRDDDGFYVEHVLPYKCKYCFNKFSKPFKYCPKCSKNEKGKYENGSF